MSVSVRAAGHLPGRLSADVVAGITLAAYAIPVSLAYATLAGLPPQVGVYGYLLGGLGYALFGSSRFLAIGPTSAIWLWCNPDGPLCYAGARNQRGRRWTSWRPWKSCS